jgi:hypothetical protein
MIIPMFNFNIYQGKNLPIKPLTILSDKSSGKNFRNPKKYNATHP